MHDTQCENLRIFLLFMIFSHFQPDHEESDKEEEKVVVETKEVRQSTRIKQKSKCSEDESDVAPPPRSTRNADSNSNRPLQSSKVRYSHIVWKSQNFSATQIFLREIVFFFSISKNYLATSLPPPGSDTPRQLTTSPKMEGFKKFSLSSSDPNWAKAGVDISV